MRATVFAIVLASIPPLIDMDGYVYQEDPCVEALRGAMEAMEPFIPEHYQHEGNFWVATQVLAADALDERRAAGQSWREVKLQCWRH